jgi:hypothetical protein
LKNVREQIEFIEACIRGYGTAGYDIKDVKSKLEMYKAWEKDLDNTLKKEGVEYNYKPREREDIDSSESVAELIQKVNEKYDKVWEALKKEQIDRKKKAIIEKNIEAWREESREYLKYANTTDKYLKAVEVFRQLRMSEWMLWRRLPALQARLLSKSMWEAKDLPVVWEGPGLTPTMSVPIMIKGAGDAAKEFTDNRYIKDIIGFTSETSQGAITSYQKGKDITKGIKER